MKMKHLILACALSTTAMSFSAFAESNVCNDPLQKICTETVSARRDRDLYVKQLKEEIKAEAKINAAPRIAEMKKKVPAIRFVKRAIQEFKINNQEIMAVAQKKVVGLESVVTSPENVALLKKYMKQAIDESKFDSVTKEKFKSVMDSIIIGNFADFLDRTNLEDSVFAQVLMNHCGSDGLVDNAFATTFGSDRYVLVCPGFLITTSQTADIKERFNSILHAISHEMGHHIDNSKVGDALYKPFLGCLADNYSDRFNKTKEDEKFCKDKKTTPEACNLKVATSHAGELIADAWGIKVTNIHARTEQYSHADTDALLVGSWSKLCGTGDEGIHPTGDFRIGTLLGMNKDLSDYMSCGTRTNGKPACSFDGAVNF